MVGIVSYGLLQVIMDLLIMAVLLSVDSCRCVCAWYINY